MVKNEEWYNKLWLTKEWQVNNPSEFLTSSTVYKGVKIGVFYRLQKNIYYNGVEKQDGKKYYYGNILDKEQQMILEESKIFEHSKNVKFYQGYNEALEYAKNNKTLHGYTNSWMKKVRNIYNNGKLLKDGSIYLDDNNFLSFEQVNKLEELNLYLEDFYTFNDKSWDRNFNILFKYYSLNGLLPVGNIVYEGVRLGYWCYLQKTIYFNGKEDENGNVVLKNENRTRIITKRQILKLKSIGLLEDKKKNMINSICEFDLENCLNDCNISKKEFEKYDQVKKYEILMDWYEENNSNGRVRKF